MDGRQIADILVLNALGIKPSMAQFRDRLVVQKTIYLAQEIGIDLGYHFGWYLRGPYCSVLSDDMFAAIADPDGVDNALARWKLDPAWGKPLGKLQKLIGTLGSDLASRLELLASVQFLVSRGKSRELDAQKITAQLKAFGKEFSVPQVREAVRSLQGANLFTRARSNRS